jgi:lysyl-tRNA synthetase class 2
MGRVTARRDQSAGLVFLDIADASGSVQIRAARREYVGWDDVGKGGCEPPTTGTGGTTTADPSGSTGDAVPHRRFAAEVGAARRGDAVAVMGRMMRTRRGELSVVPRALAVLTPCLAPLPERGAMTDPEERVRRREVDLLSNLGTPVEPSAQQPQVPPPHTVVAGGTVAAIRARALVLRAFRAELDARGYLEVETPTMWPSAGGARAAPFLTSSRALGRLHLRVAPELFLKRLVVGGLDRVYEIGRCYRNESADSSHNPEFSSIELYRGYADYEDMMDETERLIRAAARAVVGDAAQRIRVRRFGLAAAAADADTGVEVDFSVPFRRWDVVEAVESTAGCTFPPWAFVRGNEARLVDEILVPIAAQHGIPVDDVVSDNAAPAPAPAPAAAAAAAAAAATLFDRLVSKLVEPQCVAVPTFLMHHPVFMSPLALEHRDPRFAGRCERFELVILGKEIANAYTELADPVEQRVRVRGAARTGGGENNGEEAAAAAAAAAVDEECAEADDEFADALEYGLPPTGGLGIGIDRLVMILCDAASIREVIAFPAMRKEVA